MNLFPKMDKHKRYRLKCISEGLCPHCGKPCAPYYECDDRRFYRKSNRTLNDLVKLGFLEKTNKNGRNFFKRSNKSIKIEGRSKGYYTKPDDIRHLPRVGKKYIDIERLITEVCKESGKPMGENDIVDNVWEKIKEIKLGSQSIL